MNLTSSILCHILEVHLVGKLIINWQSISHQPFIRKTSLKKNSREHIPISHVHKEFTWFGNMSTSTGRDPVSFFTIEKIEYNGTSLNRSSLISQTQTQTLNPLYTLLNYPSQIPSKEKPSTLCKYHKVLSLIFPG